MASTRKTNHKKKYNTRKKHNPTGRLALIFVTTLTAVVTIGLGIIFVQSRIKNTEDDYNVADDGTGYDHYKLTHEAIPEDIPEEEVAAVVEAAVEEIKENNLKYADQIGDPEYLKNHNIYVKDAKADAEGGDTVTLTFAGDILFDPAYAVMAKLRDNGGDIQMGISPDLLRIMQDSDIMMLNNEFPYSDRGTPTEGKQYTFRAKPESVKYLDDMGVDIVSIANNHAYDFGESAFLDTLDTLNNAGMPYVGGGRNIDEASQAVFFIINDIKIGFLSATQIERLDNPDTKGATDSTPGVFRCWNNKRMLEKIAQTKEECDFLVVYIHWGTESTTELDWAQLEQAPQMVQAGANLIIGDHPHVLQPISAIDGAPVVYSLGNFWFNSKELNTGMVQATINGDGLTNLKFIPAVQSGCKTHLATGDEAISIINEVNNMSPKVFIDNEGYISY